MVGWHHRQNGHGFEWTPGVGDGRGGLACCDSWGRQESDTTEQLILSDLTEHLLFARQCFRCQEHDKVPELTEWEKLCANHKSDMGSVPRTYKECFKLSSSSVIQSCPTLCDPMNHSTPGLPVHHQLPEFTQTHVHRVSDAIQPSHPLSSPSPPAPKSLPASESFLMSQLFA